MKFACLRCKHKKIKCDKAEPNCHKCSAAGVECHYVERSPRPRHTQQRIVAAALNQRLELLEQQISNVGSRIDITPHRSGTETASISTPLQGIVVSTPITITSPALALPRPDGGEDSWIYRMATNTRRQIQTQTTPVGTPTSQIDTEMSALNDALEDLRNLRLGNDLAAANISLNITPDEAKQCIDSFCEIMDTLIVPGFLAATLNSNLLQSLPYIIGSQYISVEPGVHVMYYAAINYGLAMTRRSGHVSLRAAFLKALEHVPAWLETSTDSEMDGYTALISSWMAIDNMDYQLSWKFHLKACHYLISKAVDHLDLYPARTFDEEEKRESSRQLFWQVLSVDCLFRLFLGKPTVLRWNPRKVRPPTVLTPRNMHPSPIQATLTCAWVSSTSRTIELMNSIDAGEIQSHSVAREVDECCRRLEKTIKEWRMDAIMHDETVDVSFRCVAADHVMNIYALIIGLKRLAKRMDNIDFPDAVTLVAARRMIALLLHINEDSSAWNQQQSSLGNYLIHFINFYPFCAIFALYEYIMACTNPEDCEEDVNQLERVGEAMEHSSRTAHYDLKPFTKTIKALNKLSRTIQESRRKRSPETSGGPPGISSGTTDQTNGSSFTVPEYNLMAFDMIPDLPMTVEGDIDPLGVVRAMETDFIGRNWNGEWWDTNGGMTNWVDPSTGLGQS